MPVLNIRILLHRRTSFIDPSRSYWPIKMSDPRICSAFYFTLPLAHYLSLNSTSGSIFLKRSFPSSSEEKWHRKVGGINCKCNESKSPKNYPQIRNTIAKLDRDSVDADTTIGNRYLTIRPSGFEHPHHCVGWWAKPLKYIYIHTYAYNCDGKWKIASVSFIFSETINVISYCIEACAYYNLFWVWARLIHFVSNLIYWLELYL